MIMRVGLGVTSLARGLLHHGVDGIGYTTLELYRQLVGPQQMQVLPVSFGHSAFEQIDPNNPGLLLPRFGPLVGPSTLTGLPIWGNKQLERKVDIFHATDHYIPKLGKTPMVATVHDAIPFTHPEWTPLRHRLLISPVFKHSARWAQKLITVSHFSKAQIVDYFGIAPEKISVIPNGLNERWFKPVDHLQLEALLRKYQLPKRYVIFVGTLQPRKNIESLIRAYQSLPAQLRREFALVIIGRAGWGCDGTVNFIYESAQNDHVKWLKYLPQEHLETLVKGAASLALPSLAEGFGLPVVEAFAAGVPVLTSNTTSLPEIAGDAALLVDPTRTESIADGLVQILDNPALATQLKMKGLARARQFSWERTAEETVAVYRSLVQ